MVHSMIYSLRGWIAFVAFINMATAFRCFLDTNNYLGRDLFLGNQYLSVSPAVGRIFGFFHILITMVLIHSAFRIEYYPLISSAQCSLFIIILYFAVEAFYYKTIYVGFSALFPIVISVFTMAWIAVAPWYLGKTDIELNEEEIMKRLVARKKRWNKKRD